MESKKNVNVSTTKRGCQCQNDTKVLSPQPAKISKLFSRTYHRRVKKVSLTAHYEDVFRKCFARSFQLYSGYSRITKTQTDYFLYTSERCDALRHPKSAQFSATTHSKSTAKRSSTTHHSQPCFGVGISLLVNMTENSWKRLIEVSASNTYHPHLPRNAIGRKMYPESLCDDAMNTAN